MKENDGVEELKLIREISRRFDGGSGHGVSLGIGDDCAAITIGKDTEIVVTTDSLTEGIHFKNEWMQPAEAGYKSVCVSVSDIAAMGATARHILLCVNGPPSLTMTYMRKYLSGFKQACDEFDLALIGGNYSNSPGDLSFAMTVIGEVRAGYRVSRSGARPGDIIYVTGTPGDSALGLEILQSGQGRTSTAERRLVKRHKRPSPRLGWGRLLADRKLASAMMDISDGVALDLKRLIEASDVSGQMSLENFPLSKDAINLGGEMDDRFWRRILTGGEDYELLFTANQKNARAIDRLVKSGSIDATAIGEIVDRKAGLRINLPSGKRLKIGKYGWSHNNK